MSWRKAKYVTLEFDWQRHDKYNRLLDYVYLDDGTLLNKKIIKEGYCHAYTRYPFKYLDEFQAAEIKARRAGKGLWSPTSNLTREEVKQVKQNKIPTSDNVADQVVYVSNTGAKYHRSSCRYLRKSKFQ